MLPEKRGVCSLLVYGGFNKYLSIFILILIILSILYTPLVYSPDLSACATINASTTYTLTQNVETTSSCFVVNGDNIILDCQGFNVTGDGGGGEDGVDVPSGAPQNITVRHCNFRNFGGDGINFFSTNHSTIFNNTIGGSTIGIFLDQANYNNVSLNTIFNISSLSGGIYLGRVASDNDIRNNTIYNVSAAISAESTVNNDWNYSNLIILNNTIYNIIQRGIYLEGVNNSNISFNTIYNVTGNGINIFGDAYRNIIYSNTVYNVSVSALRLSRVFDTNISLNSFYNNSLAGIFVNASENIRIYDHTILENNTLDGIVVFCCSNYTNLSNNIIRSNRRHGINVVTNSLYTNITGNTIFNNSVAGIQLLDSNYTNITDNTLSNNTYYGLLISNGSYNNVSFNTIFNNSQAGIFINGTRAEGNRFFQNTIHNHTIGLAAGIYVNTTNLINHIYDNNLIQNNTYGIYLDYANYTNITNNNVSRNTDFGIFVRDNSLYTNITSNTIFNNSISGIAIIDSNYTNITDNTLSNNTYYGLLISNGSYNNVSFNTIFNNSQAGIFINGTRAEGNRFFQNTIHNHTIGLAAGIYVNTTNLINHIYDHDLIQNNTYGIYLDYANYTNITNNNVSRNTDTGLLLSFSNNVNISNNTFFNNTRIGVNISRSIDTILNSNLANYSQYGFNSIYSNRLNFSENNATNNSNSQYYFDFDSNATFLGVNRALNHTVNVSDIAIYGGSNITTRSGSTYNNFTTSFGTFFFDAATNVSMEAVSFANSGTTETGCTGFDGTCTLITPRDFVVNITNNDNSATTDLGIYYEDTSGVSSSNLYIARYSGSGWNRTGQTTVDTTLKTVRYNGITSFSIFGIANFVATPATTTTTTTTTSDDSGGGATVTTPASTDDNTTAAGTGGSLPGGTTTVTVEVVAAEDGVPPTIGDEGYELAEEEDVFEATAPFQAVAKITVDQKIEGTDDSESAQLVYGVQKGMIGGVDVEIPKVNLNLQIKKPKTITATLDLDLIPYMRHTMSLLFLLFIVLSLLTIKDASVYVTEIPRGITAKSYVQPKPVQRNVYITVNDWINNGNRRL